MLFAFVIASLSGLTRILTRMVNAQLSEHIGPFQSTFYNYTLGLFSSLILLALSKDRLPVSALTSVQIPFWAYFGGIVGVLFVALSNRVTPKMSAFSMTLLIFVGQIGTGIAIDFTLNQQFSIGKLIGAVLVLAGLLGNLSAGRGLKGKSLEQI